jgi:hypothetical protein
MIHHNALRRERVIGGDRTEWMRRTDKVDFMGYTRKLLLVDRTLASGIAPDLRYLSDFG